MSGDDKIFLNCPFEEKDKAKKAGARWDTSKQTWFVPKNKWDVLETFNEWTPNGRIYLDCPFEEKDKAKAKGARFDGMTKKWYFLPAAQTKKLKSQEKDFAEWLPNQKIKKQQQQQQQTKKSTPQKKRKTTEPLATPSASKSSSTTRAIKKPKASSTKTTKATPTTKKNVSNSSNSPSKKPKPSASSSSIAPPNPKKRKTASPASIGLKALPRITSDLTSAQLKCELMHRHPETKGISKQNKPWFLRQLGIGSIWESSPKAIVAIGIDNKSNMPTVSEKLTIAQLSHELLERNPNEKGLSGKNKTWFLEKLRPGSLWITGDAEAAITAMASIPKEVKKEKKPPPSPKPLPPPAAVVLDFARQEKLKILQESGLPEGWTVERNPKGRKIWILGDKKYPTLPQALKAAIAVASTTARNMNEENECNDDSDEFGDASLLESFDVNATVEAADTNPTSVRKKSPIMTAAKKARLAYSADAVTSHPTSISAVAATAAIAADVVTSSGEQLSKNNAKAKKAASKPNQPASVKVKVENESGKSTKGPKKLTPKTTAKPKEQASKTKKITNTKVKVEKECDQSKKAPRKKMPASAANHQEDKQTGDVKVKVEEQERGESKKAPSKKIPASTARPKEYASQAKVARRIASPKAKKEKTTICTRCNEEARKGSVCQVPHPEHLQEHTESSYGYDGVSHTMSCKACKVKYTQTSQNDECPRWQVPITEGNQWCYEGPHTTQQLHEEDKRRVYKDLVVIRAGPNIQQEIDALDGNEGVGVLRICSERYDTKSSVELAILLPDLTELQLENINMGKIRLNQNLTPKLRKIWMQNPTESEHPDFEIICPELQDFSCYYWGPGDDSWVNIMLRAATKLVSFDSYKIRVETLTVASNHLDNIRLHRAECLTDLRLWAPRLRKLDVQAAYNLDRIEFMRDHALKNDLPSNFNFDEELEINDMNACLGPVADMAIMSHERVRKYERDEDSMSDDEDNFFGSVSLPKKKPPPLSTSVHVASEMKSGAIPLVSSSVTVAQLKAECITRNPDMKGLSGKNKAWLISLLGEGSELQSSDEYKAKANQAAQALHVHKSRCHPHPLAKTNTLKIAGRSRSQTAVCDINHVYICTRQCVYSCERCDFDICSACYEIESLEQKEKKEKLKQKYDQRRKEEEERARAYREQLRLNEERMRAEEERRRVEFERREAEKEARRIASFRHHFENIPDKVCHPTHKHKNANKKLKYTVWTCSEDRYEGVAPEKEFDSSFDTLAEANQRVEFVFYVKNPWGYEDDEMMMIYIDEDKTDKSNGTRRMSCTPDGSDAWIVSVMPSVAFDFVQSEPDFDEDTSYEMVARMGFGRKRSEEPEEPKHREQFSKAVREPSAKHKNVKKKLKYTVWSSCGYHNDGWHSYDGPPQKEFNSSYNTLEEANERVEFVFYHDNPWGLGLDEMFADEDRTEKAKGTRFISCRPDDSETWTVSVVPSFAFDYLND